MIEGQRVAVVLPCFRTPRSAVDVISALHDFVDIVIAVDDACPDATGRSVEAAFEKDPRVSVEYLENNLGVGGATLAGFQIALAQGADVIVKIDSDGQMAPDDMNRLIAPIISGQADMTKGNRFYDPRGLAQMPVVRQIGNAGLSFLTKWASGYWKVFDPTNGYLALHARLVERLPFDRIDRRYFFESDLLFRLYLLRASIQDVPMPARYGEETSHLSEFNALFEFLLKNLRNGMKRIILSYFLHDFRVASLQMIVGLSLAGFGAVYGATTWLGNSMDGRLSSAGEVMLAALPIVLGAQFLLAALHEDVSNAPERAIHPLLKPLNKADV